MKIRPLLAAACCALGLNVLPALAVTPAQQLNDYAHAAGITPDPAAGQKFFTSRHGHDWSCASCHTDNPLQAGKHAESGRRIAPLAPAANHYRFTNHAKTERWFHRTCIEVVGRECSATEKADVLAWLISLKQ